MNRPLSFLSLVCLLLVALGCEEVVRPDLETAEPVTVVEARVSDRPGDTYVSLSRTTAYDEEGLPPVISGAEVRLQGPNGTTAFEESGEPGRYTPQNGAFVGLNGQRYVLEVSVEGNEYTAETIVPFLVEPDSLTYSFREQDVIYESGGYYLTLHLQDEPNVSNYYHWRLLTNDTLRNDDEFSLVSDENADGKPLSIELFYDLREGDRALLEWHSIDKATYEYYRSINVLTEAGSPTQAVPENPESNIQGGAIGFFSASALTTIETQIDP